MLSEFFEQPARINSIREGVCGDLLESFAACLRDNGYSQISARRHIRSAEHLVFWASRQGLSVRPMTVDLLERFRAHLARCKCGRFSLVDRVNILAGARFFLAHVKGESDPDICVRGVAPVDPELLTSFHTWMRERRGTSVQTLYNYSIPIRNFIKRIAGNPKRLDARAIRQFVLQSSGPSRWTATRCTTALRMFLRFLISEGRCRANLQGAVPVMAHWRLASVPRYLAPQEIEQLISSCDCSSPVGKRDRAILLLLARLGLRAGDIVNLQLSDINWLEASILVSGKNRRHTRLPLSQEVGDAIVSYVQEGRPVASAGALFVRSRAPFRPFASHCAVSVIVERAFDRAGVKRRGRGAAHLLRHSLASSMLRQGASLQEIGTVLRHQSVVTTQIYAKIDVSTLEQIAQAWPEASSC